MHITPDLLRSTYDYLRGLPPFRRWRLPEGDKVSFHVTRMRDFADVEECGGKYTVRLSMHKHDHLLTILMTMAHEMGHIHAGMGHGKAFQRAMDQVSKYHGFDRKAL